MRDEAIRERVRKYGLRVRCASCGCFGRHSPERSGRLRLRACPICGAVAEHDPKGGLHALRWSGWATWTIGQARRKGWDQRARS